MKSQPTWLRSLGSTKNGVFVVNATQRILTWNKAAEKLLGYSASEVLNRHCYEVIGGRLPSGKLWCEPKCKVQKCVQRGSLVQDYDVLTASKDGRKVWLDVSIITLHRKGKPLTLHLLRDATRREKGQRALEDFLDVLKAHGVLSRNQGRMSDRSVQGTPSSGSSSSRFSGLTQRELEVLKLLTRGMSTQRVAGKLGISERTVRSHVRNIFKKCGVHSRVEAVSLAWEDGLS
jgi:PAS domain S-box-containing protein